VTEAQANPPGKVKWWAWLALSVLCSLFWIVLWLALG
jgi:hypothetical protein